jgi:signal transduction histidine kinase
MKNVWSHPSSRVAAVAAVLIGAIALVAAGSLAWLHRVYRKSLHENAASAVVESGQRITRQLSNHAFVQEPQGTRGERMAFTELVRTLSTVEPSIQYVSVTEGGDIEFHEQTRPLEPSLPHRAADTAAPGVVEVKPRLMMFGDQTIPLMTFTVQAKTPGSSPRSLQVALHRDAVLVEGAGPSQAMATMFRVAIVTVSTALGVCVVVVIALVRREFQRQQRRRAEEHLAFAGALADGVIHDMRNPMNSLRLDAQLLRKEALKAEQGDTGRMAELAERMQGTVDRTDSVLTEFLYLASPDSEAVEVYDVAECVRDCAALLTPRFEKGGVSIRMDAVNQAMRARGRAIPIKRALVNVMVNAIQASPQGGAVCVTMVMRGGAIIIEIDDSGPGIAGSDREQVFEMFHSNRPGGTGLGLWMARSAIDQQGGRITLADSPGGGVRVVIRLPVANENAS